MEDVLRAYHDCRKHKRNTESALAFEARLSHNIMRLYEDLRDGSYRIGPSHCFAVVKPRPREIWAADFRDRIVHHLLYNALAPLFVPRFAADSCACLPGRGTHYGAQRLERKVRRVTQGWQQDAFYLKCDFANFFNSIDKRALDAMLAARISDPWLLSLARCILWNDPRDGAIAGPADRLARVPPHKRLLAQAPYCGLPIGNLSSQFFANIYLDALDQFVLHCVRPSGYVRYVDDFVLLHRDPQMLVNALVRIEQFAATRLALRLNPAKTILQPVRHGIDFVGHVIKPYRTVARKRLLGDALHRAPALDRDARIQTINSYLGLLRQSKNFRRQARLCKAARALGHAHPANLEKIL